MSPPLTRKAFTLLEILCAVAIVAALASLILAASQKALASGDNVGCVSNLRQMGLAIQNYCNDHEGTLPGPIFSGVESTYTQTNFYLTGILANYLGGKTGSGSPQVLPITLCPAYKRVVPPGTWPAGFAYYATYAIMKNSKTAVYDGAGRLVSPWGRYGTPPPSTLQTINYTPMKLTTLGTYCNLSQTWAIQDADGVNYGAGSTYGPGVAVKPVHGNHWNQLYFDFHVAAVPVTNQ